MVLLGMTKLNLQHEVTSHQTGRDARSGYSQGAILVLGNYRAGLTTVRELSALGYRVILGVEPGTYCVDFSRYVNQVWHTPKPIPGSHEYLEALQELIQREPDLKMFMPINESTINTITSLENNLIPLARIALPSAAIVSICHDKYNWLKFLSKTGVGCPPFRVARNLQALDDAVSIIGTPVVIRQVESGSRFGFDKVVFVTDDMGREQVLPKWPEGVMELIVQRQFIGERYNIYFAARSGVVLREQHSKCLRSASANGSGQTVEGITIHRIPALSSDLEVVVRSLEYTGVGNAQFLYDPNTEATCFLEINPRFGASYALVESIGMGLTQLAVELADDTSSTPVLKPYEDDEGTRVIGTYSDLVGLAHSIRKREIGLPGAVRWFGAACLAFLRADVHVTWSWRDPIPALTIPFYRLIRWTRHRREWLVQRFGK
jgi:predicted ATP-grasp superfamily ATP-dependent carboligase